ncbi:MAG TPA: phospholipid carrier-dependent glycosyltransferase, partial [Actinomycetota bacterium]|nr:phospholipid carrier-dependent glycosyltransferase [Actinomycetota bacterium]
MARARPWRRADTVAVIAVVALAALVRLPRLSDPQSLVFDETYYAKDACIYVHGPAALCGIDSEQTQVHPPLGKWLIAAGIRVFGYNALGWRAAPALAGLVTVALLYVL